MGGPPPGRLVLRPPFGVGQAPRDTGAPHWCRPLPRGACLWKSLGPLLERGREACEPLSGASGTEVRLGAGHRGTRESPRGRRSSCALRSVWRVGGSPPSPFTARPPLAQPAATSVPLSGSECASSRGPMSGIVQYLSFVPAFRSHGAFEVRSCRFRHKRGVSGGSPCRLPRSGQGANEGAKPSPAARPRVPRVPSRAAPGFTRAAPGRRGTLGPSGAVPPVGPAAVLPMACLRRVPVVREMARRH